MSSDVFRILSIDGGGLKGIFAAAVLAAWERDLDCSISAHFDLVAGTSTGGLIALGLGRGHSPEEMTDFYVKHAPTIFRAPRRFRALFRNRYSGERIREVFQELLGDTRLGDSNLRLLIPAYNLTEGDIYVFKTPHSHRYKRDWRQPMVDVALATSAAPTFFPAAKVGHTHMVDGGVWANNPTIVAIAEAIGVLGVPPTSIRVLSLGTSSNVLRPSASLTRGGIIPWLRYGRPVILNGPSKGNQGAAVHLIGKENAVRVNPVVPEGVFKLDSVDNEAMRSLAQTESRNALSLVESFFDVPTEAFVPLFSREV